MAQLVGAGRGEMLLRQSVQDKDLLYLTLDHAAVLGSEPGAAYAHWLLRVISGIEAIELRLVDQTP